MRHTYLIFVIFYWFNGCDKYIWRHKRQNCRSVRFTDHLYNIHERNRNRNENTTHKNSNCRSVKFTDHLYMRGRKKELPPLGIGRTMWPPPTPGQDCSVSKSKSFVSKTWSPGPRSKKARPPPPASRTTSVRLGSAPSSLNRSWQGNIQSLPDIMWIEKI